MFKLALSLVFCVLLFISGCNDGSSSNPGEDKDVSDIESGHTTDENDRDDNDGIPDDDNVDMIVLRCPESVDEEAESICEIETSIDSVTKSGDDSCYGNITGSEKGFLYKFTPTENMGPGFCKVVVSGGGKTVEADIEVKEVNNPPEFSSDTADPITFYENVKAERTFYFTDRDLPAQNENDPGFVTCSIRNNTCGFDIEVVTGNNRCDVSGTMTEEFTDDECAFEIVVTDGYGLEAFKTISAVLRERNEPPEWETEPANIEIIAGDSYNEINGVATDPDLPNDEEGSPGYLTCSLFGNNCSFDITVDTERAENGKSSCRMLFTSKDAVETCQFRLEISDGEKSIYSSHKNIFVTSSVSIDCPESVNEGEEIICNISAKGGEPTALDMFTNTCRGEVFNEEGSWKYRYTTTEDDGPKFCDAAIGIGSVTASATIEIKEVNTPPELSFSGGCADPENATATEGQNFFCNVSMSDVDRPNSDPGDPGYITCEIKNNTCGSWLSFNSSCNSSGIPDEESGGTECSYVVEVTDGYGAKVSETVIITVVEVNMAPVITVEAPVSKMLMTNETFSFTYSAADSDLPNSSEGDPGYLKCSASATGLDLQVTSTGEGSGSVDCNAQIKVSETEECKSGCSVTFSVIDGYGSKRDTHTFLVIKKCIFFVKENGEGIGGRSWEDAFGTVQEAVDESWSGCEIWVKQGTYRNPSQDGAPVITMQAGVKIIGGFNGIEVYDHISPDLRFRPEPVIQSVLDGENISYHVVVGSLNNSLLDGFIITGGNADGDSQETQVGGGMYNKGTQAVFGEPFVRNCIFTGNYAKLGGGAVYNDGFSGSFVEFRNNQFIDNTTDGYGGAVWNRNTSNVRYIECEFAGNRANIGGAVFEYNAESSIEKSFFIQNEALSFGSGGGSGGAVYISSESYLHIENSVFLKNRSDLYGGAIKGESVSSVTIDHSTFSKNTGASNTGGISAVGNVSNSIFWQSSVDLLNLSINYSFGTGDTTGTENINSMPLGSEMFINDETDLRLHSTSPAIDSADPDSILTEDITGNARPIGTKSDMGAYEYVF